jgi:nucleoside-diphosphate-sugar epimerase
MNIRQTIRLIQFRLTPAVLMRMLADAALVTIALACGLTVRLIILIAFQVPDDAEAMFYVKRDAWSFVRVWTPLMAVCLTTFWLCGFYTYGKHYVSKYKAVVVFQAVTLSFIVFGFLSYFVTGGHLLMSRGALPLSWLFAVLLLVGARMWTELWKGHVIPERTDALRATTEGKRVLVIGGAGYIGSALLPLLLERGYRVRLLDILLFGEGPIERVARDPHLELIRGDFRNVVTMFHAVQHVDAVVHLGAIVGDPACSLDEELTIDVNLVSTRMIAELARSSGVRRFVFASTCSVYGASDDMLDERSLARPVSLYGHTKRASEQVLQEMADSRFGPTILRFATIYGLSGRTRFDLVVNLLTAKAKIDGEITVHGGQQWRPFIHVEDAARAITAVLEAPQPLVANQVYNVGSDEQNYTIGQVAEMIHQHVADARLVVSEHCIDHRNYRVSFQKIARHLGFAPKWSLADGIEQVLEAIAAGDITDYHDPRYSNAKLLEEGTSKLDQDQWARELIRDLSGR